MRVKFVVYGRPQPQGSTRAFVQNGRAVVTHDNKELRSWRQDVAVMAKIEMQGCDQSIIRRPEPVSVNIDFFFSRPESLPKKRRNHTARPDLDKLIRGVHDSLTGICFEDDSQVIEVFAWKQYGQPARTEISVASMIPVEEDK
jgi:crossover junction endodeoxyribonuclease RusA